MTTNQTNEYSAYVKLGSDIIEASKEICEKTKLSPKSIENIKLCADIILRLQQTALLLANIRSEQAVTTPRPNNLLTSPVKFK